MCFVVIHHNHVLISHVCIETNIDITEERKCLNKVMLRIIQHPPSAITNWSCVSLYMLIWISRLYFCLNTLRPRQNGRHFPDDIFKCISLNEDVWISIEIPLNLVPMGPINNIPALVQIMAWRWPGDKPLSEPMMVCLLTHICVTRSQWVKSCVTTLIVLIGTICIISKFSTLIRIRGNLHHSSMLAISVFWLQCVLYQ